MYRKLHYFSGLTIAVFTGFHLLNHILALKSIQLHIDFMSGLRMVYRNPLIETALFIAVIIQIISGLRMWRSLRNPKTGFFEKLHIATGLYLALFLTIHVLAVLSGRIFQGLDTNIYYGIAGLNTFPFLLFFVPYYFLAITSFFGHIACVHRIRMRYRFLSLTPEQQSFAIIFLGISLAIVIFYGLTNGFQGSYLPQEYRLK